MSQTEGSAGDAGSEATPPPASSLPKMPEAAVLMQEGTMRFVPDKRELEKSPSLLRGAAAALIVASLIPWVGHGGGVMTLVVAKLVAALGCFFFYAAVVSRTKDPVPAGLGGLTKTRWGKAYAEKPHGFVDTLTHALPTPLHVLALLTVIASLVIAMLDPVIASRAAEGLQPASGGRAAAEVGLLLIGGLTLVHIYAYQRGGHFSPLYPFMFLAPIILGVPVLIATLGGEANVLALAGAGLSIGAGVYAVYTIIVAMMEAKKEGDAKKAAAAEARRASRRTARA